MMKEFKGDFLAIGLDCKGAKQNYLDATTNVARFLANFLFAAHFVGFSTFVRDDNRYFFSFWKKLVRPMEKNTTI